MNDDQNLINKLHILEECNVSPVRYSKDNGKIDHYGKRLLNLCKSTQLFFVNGRFGADKGVGQTTLHVALLHVLVVLDLTVLSVLILLVDLTVFSVEKKSDNESHIKPKWYRDRAAVFQENLDVNKIDKLLVRLADIDPKNTNIVTINDIV
ncbi:unnamed protein product [Mytilus edulis]|uniref:Uncharacterized protein n=1 Tax=Mytilus edulis TaxID=6550 RepID=A0A8S3UUN2_MYTED|nr:unnamed protein product [Mytilus edulis]